LIKKRHIVIGTIALVLLTSSLTFIAAILLFEKNKPAADGYAITFGPDGVDKANVDKLNQVKDLLKQYFYTEFDEDTLVEGAAAGMADSLDDPYTVYMSREEMQLYTEHAEGSYVGIGVLVSEDENGYLDVIEAYEGSPAKEAGMIPGDKIIAVDGVEATDIGSSDVIISKIKGVEGTQVSITVYRPSEDKEIELTITRKRIKVVNVTSTVLEGNIGYIKMLMFDGSAANDFNEKLDGLLEQNVVGLILDLRDDPGGDYNQVVEIADRLLPEGKIVYTEDRQKNQEVEYSDKTELEIPLVVLINGNSASASEILAAAVKDYGKGTIIGTASFGKGLVQIIIPLDDGSGLKITIAKYYTPSGTSIHGIGVEPDIVVELDEKYKDSYISQVPVEDDLQLQKAIEVIKESQ
jgi:carboxyl-terminal processing protease